MAQEGGPRIETFQPARRRPVPGQPEQRGDRCPGSRVPAAVRDGNQGRRRCQAVWIPHSVLPVPVHRPLRGSAPGATGSVQVAQPIDG